MNTPTNNNKNPDKIVETLLAESSGISNVPLDGVIDVWAEVTIVDGKARVKVKYAPPTELEVSDVEFFTPKPPGWAVEAAMNALSSGSFELESVRE